MLHDNALCSFVAAAAAAATAAQLLPLVMAQQILWYASISHVPVLVPESAGQAGWTAAQ